MSRKSRAEAEAALASVDGTSGDTGADAPAPPKKAKTKAAGLAPKVEIEGEVAAAAAEPETVTDEREAAPLAERRGLVAPAEIAYRETLTIAEVFESPLNPRRRINPDGLRGLALSIAQKGLLQPLLCRPAEFDADKGPFEGVTRAELILGARRRRAIEMAIAGVSDDDGQIWRLPADYKIPLRLRYPTSDRDLRILAATENFDREDMDPLDEADLFESLRADVTAAPGKTPEAAIAELFPKISERTVFRRRQLLRCAPVVQHGLRDGRITLAQAEAFTVAGIAEQEALFAEIDAEDGWRGNTPTDIRHTLAEDMIAVEGSGIDPELYTGEIVEDAGEGERYFVDTAQVRRLRREALDARAEELRRQWPWADIVSDDANRAYRDYVRFNVADDDAEAGAVVFRQSWPPFEITVFAPVLRLATVEARQAAERTAERSNAASGPESGGRDPADQPSPARPPLSTMQVQRLHEVKTQALRRAIAEPVRGNTGPGAEEIALAIGILGLGGAREIRNMVAGGYDPAWARVAPFHSAAREQDRLAHLVKTASLAVPSEQRRTRVGDGELGLSQNGHDSANVTAWFWALLALTRADLAELFRRLLAERAGSWATSAQEYGAGSSDLAQLGDTPLALALAVATGAEVYLGELWRPDLDWFKGYSRERLIGIVRDQLHIRNADKMKKGELAALCAEQPKGFWKPAHFPECRFQLEADAAEALAGPLPEISEPAAAAE